MQPDEGQEDETPTLEKLPPLNHKVDASQVSISMPNTRSDAIEQNDTSVSVVTHIIDHTSPASPCSTKSGEDNGEQKLSTPGAASSGYGSAVLTQTTSSDDLLGDHTGSEDINAEPSSVGHLSSMVVTAGVNIIDADVPTDLDSPLKPTTPYADEPANVLPVSTDISISHSSPSNVDVVNTRHEVNESSQQYPAVPSHTQRDANVETVVEEEPSVSQVSDLEKQSSTELDDGDMRDSRHMVESTSISPDTNCEEHIGDGDATITNDSVHTDLLPKTQSAEEAGITARSTMGSLKTSYRPVSMPPEMTIIEDEKLDITALGMQGII